MSSTPFKALSIGLAAGLAATAVMTIGQTVEARITKREDSNDPAKAVEDLTGARIEDERQEKRLSTAVHFAYGTLLGGALALLKPIREPARTAAFFAGSWSLGALIETFIHPDKPPPEWDAQQLVTDIGHHLLYAATAGLAYRQLERTFAAD